MDCEDRRSVIFAAASLTSTMLLPSVASVLILLVVSQVETKECEEEQNETWSYKGKNGPRNWGKTYPKCNGENQSPINIDTHAVKKDDTLTEIVFTNYETPVTAATVVNNGHTVQVTTTDGVTRSIQGGGLSGVYTLSQFHFHWGSRSTRGSEHLINRRRYAMEMHLVHSNGAGQLAVIGVFFEESAINNPSLGPLAKVLQNIKYKNESTTPASALHLNHLLPLNQNEYYRYSGSLTTPSCDEIVTWTVYAQPLPIGTAQIQEFRRLYGVKKSDTPQHECHLVDNYRPVQKLNDREVSAKRSNWRR